MKSPWVMAAVACAALSMPGCGTPAAAADLIIGNCESVEPPGALRLEFTKDGTATVTMLGQRLGAPTGSRATCWNGRWAGTARGAR